MAKITRNRIARANVAERYYYLTMALRAQLRRKRLGLPEKSISDVLADYGLKRGGNTVVCCKLAAQEEMPTLEQVAAIIEERARKEQERKHPQQPSEEELQELAQATAEHEAAEAKIRAFYTKYPKRRESLRDPQDIKPDLFNC